MKYSFYLSNNVERTIFSPVFFREQPHSMYFADSSAVFDKLGLVHLNDVTDSAVKNALENVHVTGQKPNRTVI